MARNAVTNNAENIEFRSFEKDGFRRNSPEDLRDPKATVGNAESVACSVIGSAAVLYGLKRFSLPGLALAVVGGALAYRGFSGTRDLCSKINLGSSKPSADDRIRHSLHNGIHLERNFVVNKPVEEVFAFWRHLENLPHFMSHLKSVRQITKKRSHWVAEAPAGLSVKWDAEIINETENELIAWKSLPGSDVDNAGVVRFEPIAGGSGTRLHIAIRYSPPGKRLGAQLARLFKENPERQLDKDLECFIKIMNEGRLSSGEIPVGLCDT